MKTNTKWVMALLLAGLGVWLTVPGCKKEETTVTVAEKEASEKAAVEKALADKAAADKAAVDKAMAEKMAADKIAAEKTSAVDKALTDKAISDKMAADVAASKAAADKMAAAQQAEAGSLPADLVMMKSEMAGTLSQIDLTFAKLDVLAATTGSVRAPSKDTVASIDALDASTQSVKKRATDMRDRGAAYFDTWDKQLAAMSTPAVAALAAQRKDELTAKYTEVLTSMQETRSAFDPFWADMQTIRAAVDNGLTPDSQKVLVTQIAAAKEKAATLKTRVQATSDKLNQVSVIYKRP